MVIVHLKQKDESQFLYETTLQTSVDVLIKNVVAIYNGRLKVHRICCEIQELAKHGILYPPEILGLTPEQVEEMKLEDPYEEKCIPSGGFIINQDPIGRRNGRQPKKDMQEVLNKAVKDAKEMISKNLVPLGKLMTLKVVQEALNILKGAVTIVYPMKLPPHDVIRMEFENIEDLTGTQASLDVIDPVTAQLWFCGKEMFRDKIVADYVGKVENCKVIMKLSKKGSGAPAREPIMNEEDRKQMMMHAYRKQEELKKLNADDDDSYLNSEWADSTNMKKSFHGLTNISWRPGKPSK
ncbi:cilia- and flagella-associated protein 298 [Coccinella septempunctata]|uniref:cilia- and flagella-associated protein 298 n=1 Tax=Coccinella septempunctata TaxID=41139 RepID=UPI001D07F98A|nr:cilia- and flagella-associated protein 298 [Coccinella septempunctata]